MGLSRNCKGGPIELERFFCGEKKEKNLEIHPVMYFLDGLERKE